MKTGNEETKRKRVFLVGYRIFITNVYVVNEHLDIVYNLQPNAFYPLCAQSITTLDWLTLLWRLFFLNIFLFFFGSRNIQTTRKVRSALYKYLQQLGKGQLGHLSSENLLQKHSRISFLTVSTTLGKESTCVSSCALTIK